MVNKKKGKIVLNKPMPSTRSDKKMMVYVKNPRTKRIRTIHFGDKEFRQNYSKEARKRYLARSSGIRDRYGRLTKNNPLSANYWARTVLWGAKKLKPKRRKKKKK